MSKFKKIIIILLIIGIVIGAFFVYSKLKRATQIAYTYAIAQRLGYTDDAKLVQTYTCWDLASHCGISIHYTTTMDQIVLEKKIEDMGMTKVLNGQVDGSTIFTEINYFSHRTLTSNNIDPSRTRGSTHIKDGFRWWYKNTSNESYFIYFYPATDAENIYRIDGKQINGNIVTIMLQTK